MIELVQVSTIFSAPVDTVFKYVTNMENYIDWFPGVLSIKSKNSLPHATVGKTYLEALQFPDSEYELTIEVAQCEVNRLFLTKGDLEGVLPQMKIEFFADAENKCHMHLQYHSRNSNLTEKSETIILLKKDLGNRVPVGISNLKNIVEVSDANIGY
jgi:uncharacterized protein YndB with AHSA1/START domain